MFVVKGLKMSLLGLPAIVALGLAVRVDSANTTTPTVAAQTHRGIQKQFPTLFQGLGNLGAEYEKSDATPHSLFTPRRVPLPLRPKVKEELDRMESIGVISKVDIPIPWCAGMIVVPRKEVWT